VEKIIGHPIEKRWSIETTCTSL